MKLKFLSFVFLLSLSFQGFSEIQENITALQNSKFDAGFDTGNIDYYKICDVEYLKDDNEPEMILTIGNRFKLLCKCSHGTFTEGQAVGLCFTESGHKLLLLTYADGKVENEIVFYRLMDSIHFYQAL